MQVILFAVGTLFLLPGCPETTLFLTEEERQIIVAHRPENQPTAKLKPWDWEQVWVMLYAPLFYKFLVIWGCHAIGGLGVATGYPTVILALVLGDPAITQLLTMPRFVIGRSLILVLAWIIRGGKLNQ